MAVRNYGGFGAGLAQGFGLVQGVQDRFDRNELAKDTLEAKVASDEATEDFRADQLRLQNRENEIRLAGQTASALATAEYRAAEQTETNRRNIAEEALKREKQAFEQDPNNPANVKTTLENERRQSFATAQQHAVNVQTVSNIIEESNGMPTPDQMQEIIRLGEENQKGRFAFGMLVSNSTMESARALGQFKRDMSQVDAQGKYATPVMSPEVLQAYSLGLGIPQMAAKGRRLDSSFVNAPEPFRNGDWEVARVGLLDATGAGVSTNSAGGKDYNVTARTFVEVRNVKTGELDVYPAPLTKNRAINDSESLVLNLAEADEAAMGHYYMAASLKPKLESVYRRAMTQKRYGDIDGDGLGSDGSAELKEAVEGKVRAIVTAINGGDSNTYIDFISKAEAAPFEGGQLSEAMVAKISKRVEDDLLYDVNSLPPQQNVHEYFESTRTALAGIKAPPEEKMGDYKYKKQELNGQEGVLLGDIVTLDNYEMIAQLNQIADDPKKLAAWLVEKNHLVK